MDEHTRSLLSEPSATRAQRAAAARAERERRHAVAERIAQPLDGVATIAMLLEAGLTRGQIQGEIERGVWTKVGRHTVRVTATGDPQRAGWWTALWESGRQSVLDGATALIAAGLTSWTERVIHVSVPNRATVRALDGVVHHRLRRIGPVVTAGLRRTKPEVAVIRAAQWERSDRAAATIVAMTVQQRLASPASVLSRWSGIHYSTRRALLHDVIQDVCNGAHSLSELDFARECRRRGLPEPKRQVVRMGPHGRVYLDVFWDGPGLHIEIQGAHHYQGLGAISDSLRFNDVRLQSRDLTTLQVPVLGLRTQPEAFFAQIQRALAAGRVDSR